MAQLSMKSLIESGVHYGHLARKWNPKMKPFIFGIRNNVHIINLQYTVETAREAGQFMYNLGKAGKKVLFVGTKKQAQDIIVSEAKRVGAYYVNERWLGGTLTNFNSISTIATNYNKTKDFLESDIGLRTSKKERSKLEKKLARIEKYCQGILDMDGVPDAVFVIDINREKIAVHESRTLNIPVVAIVDTNADPANISYPIPGNDDALKAISLFTHYVAESYFEGKKAFDEGKLQDKKENEEVKKPKAKKE